MYIYIQRERERYRFCRPFIVSTILRQHAPETIFELLTPLYQKGLEELRLGILDFKVQFRV